jgi:ankyrin repeat protein
MTSSVFWTLKNSHSCCGWCGKKYRARSVLVGVEVRTSPLDFDLGELLISPSESLDQGRHTAIELLLFEGLYPNCHGADYTTLLERASEKGQTNIVNTLLRFRANVNVGRVPPLHSAASGGHQEIVEMLLNARSNVDTIAGSGRTALQYAALKGHRVVVTTLLKAGANVNLATAFGETALQLVISGKHDEVV